MCTLDRLLTVRRRRSMFIRRVSSMKSLEDTLFSLLYDGSVIGGLIVCDIALGF
jgi:hypothetical protein